MQSRKRHSGRINFENCNLEGAEDSYQTWLKRLQHKSSPATLSSRRREIITNSSIIIRLATNMLVP